MKTFKMQHRFAPRLMHSKYGEFDEDTAPDWLTSINTVPGSTMDGRWFWNDHVLTLDVNASIDTDFQTITRIT